MLENLESLPPRHRPRMLSIWMLGSPHIRVWRTARWFLALLVPILASVIASVVRGLPWLAAFTFALIGIAVAFCLFATIASGVESSNWGTFFRKREPGRFWIGVVILVFFYTGISAAGWIAHVDEPGPAVGRDNLPIPNRDSTAERN